MIDIFYGTIFLMTYILININNRYNIFDKKIKQMFNCEKEEYYIIKTFYNFRIYNFLMFLLCIWINEIVLLVVLFNIINLVYYKNHKKGNYIYNCNDILLYITVYSFSSLPINKILSMFGICFTDFEIISNNNFEY